MPFFGSVIRAYKQFVKQKAREETPPRYIIEEPGDILHVPADRLDIFLSELKTGITTVRGMLDSGLLNRESAHVAIKRFIWIDDGKTEGKITIKEQ